jgi:type VI secretion system protein ImpL
MLKPWVFAGVGLLGFGVLVWFAGPLLVIAGEAPLAAAPVRALVIGVFTLQYLAQKLWSLRRARRNNERVVAELRPPLTPGLPAEAEQLRERFSDALAQLRQMRFAARSGYSRSWRFGRSYLYQLPWYMIIGAPGAGKTTALLNAGLNFPLDARLGRGPVPGFGGTRNCDWWFTDRAVLIDTAGRYTTHDSNRVADRQAWEAFLQLLRRARPRRPLNGVLVAVSVGDLLGFNAGALAEHARILRARLDELQSALKVRLPVYFLLTKCDLLPGFVDWFGSLDRSQRDQVFGVTLELRAENSAPAALEFAPSFDALLNRLADSLVERLKAERDAQRRARIFSLPRSLRALAAPLGTLVNEAFGSSASPGEGTICLRGVYLTSGTQQGTPIDRMLSAFGRELGLEQQILPANQSTGKSFFLSRLLTEVVFAESELSADTPLRARWQRRGLLASLVSVQLCALALATWWVAGYFRSVDDMARLEDEVTGAAAVVDAMPSQAGADPRALLPALDALRTLAHARRRTSERSELIDLGSRSRLKLSAASHEAYERMLLGALQGRIVKAIDATLRSGADVNLQYEALKAYAMLTDPAHFDAAGLEVFVLSDWNSALTPPLSATERQQLVGHLDALLAAGAVGSGVTLEPALIDSVRSRLTAQSPAERIALRLSVAIDSRPFADFTVASLGEPAATLFVGAEGRSPPRAVPGRFTIEAYEAVVIAQAPSIAAQLASESSWVLKAAQDDPVAGLREFMASYRERYAQAWSALIEDLHLLPAASNEEAIRQAQALGTPGGALEELVNEIVRQTPLQTANGAEGPIARSDPGAGRLIALGTLASAGGNTDSALNGVLESFRELATLRTPSAPGAAASGAAAPRELARLTADAQREAEPIRSMLLALAVLPAPAAPPAPANAAALSREIASRLGPACLRLVAGQFPFDRTAPRDATLESFSRLFAPRGAFDQVFAQLLAPRVDTSTENWRARTPAAGPDAQELERFRAAARIRDVFFAQGAAQPALQLTFRPLDMDQNIDRFQLEVDGQLVRYAHGPLTATTVKWPARQGSARIEVTPAAEGPPLEYNGPWALFRLFDHAAIQQADSPGSFRVVFDVGGRHASFEVRSDGGGNPFRLHELEHFDCPISGS